MSKLVPTAGSTLAQQIRQLAEDIRNCAQQSPAYSAVCDITSHCAGHLELLAGWHEAILRESEHDQIQNAHSETGTQEATRALLEESAG